MSVCAHSSSCLWQWLLRATVLVLATLLPGSSACPKSCACYVPSEVHCTFRYLTTIPSQIQPAVERINLGYNSIMVLRQNDLVGLERLELLMLHSNTIHSIEDGAFQDLKSLQVLKMSYNRVKEITRETFRGLESLLRLHMDHNRVEFISPEAFYGLAALQLVHLEGNLLQQLHPDTFITLRHSQVFRVSSVRSIHLSDNLLTSLPVEVFSDCSQLENLFLHGNPWSCDCHMDWFPDWAKKHTGVLKCRRDRKYSGGQLCPLCESPITFKDRALSKLPGEALACTKPWIHPHLKLTNISLEEGDFTPVSPRDFIAPIGSLHMNLTDQLQNEASLSCTVQRPSATEDLALTLEEEGDHNVTMLTATVATSLICNIDYEHIQPLWRVLATYSDSSMRLERGLMLSRSPAIVYRYRQVQPEEEGHEEIHTGIEAEISASPAWMMQGEVSFQLDRATTTFSTLHIKYRAVVNLRLESGAPKKDRYGWTMIQRDNQTKTQHAVLIGAVVEMSCQALGNPRPSVEWILADGSKVRAPYATEDHRVVISADGRLTLRGADISDAGLYRCIATNYLDADILSFRVVVLSPDVEEFEVNGLRLTRPRGQSLVLDCYSTGSPEASVQWILPDNTVLDKSHGNRQLYSNGTLSIQSLTGRDRGFYRCLAANPLGADLLVSQVTITGQGLERDGDSEGSGLGLQIEVDVDPSLEEEGEVSISESPSSGPSSSRISQESRTITSNRPYPRLRTPQERGGAGVARGRLGQRRRGPLDSRHTWNSRRVFDKASRKVDPQRFAEFMKKAQGGAAMKTEKEDEKAVESDSDSGLSGDGDTGSGEGQDKESFIVSNVVTVTATHSPQESRTIITSKQNFNSQAIATASRPDSTTNAMTTENGATIAMVNTDLPISSRTGYTKAEVTTDTLTTESYTKAEVYTHSPARGQDSQAGAVKPLQTVSDHTTSPHAGKSSESQALERITKEALKRPVTLRLTVTETSQEAELRFSGEPPAEAESSTGALVSFFTDPHVTPMMDGPGPSEPVVHTSTDPESQTTFTAVTTTERQQDEITFHTTQRINSRRLPAGSTIISRQQIHIIPPKTGRGGGRRRTSPGRRRVIKPNRITDIQSILNKLKQPALRKQGNTTVPYSMELTTDCDCDEDGKRRTTSDPSPFLPTTPPSLSSSSMRRTESPVTTPYSTSTRPTSRLKVSSGYITSADAPESDPTPDPYVTTVDERLTTTTAAATTTTCSNDKTSNIPLESESGSKKEQNNMSQPLSSTFAAAASTSMPTTTASVPRAGSLPKPATDSPSRHRGSSESSADEDNDDDEYGDSSSDGSEGRGPSTPRPSSRHQTTTPSYPSRPSTTAGRPAETQTIASPPTATPAHRGDPEDPSLSGSESGGSNWFSRQFRGNRRKNGGGQIRRPFIRRRPFRKTTTTTKATTTTTKATTTMQTTMEITMETTMETTMDTTIETTALPQRTVSVSKPLYTPSREAERSAVTVSTDVTSEEETPDSSEKKAWDSTTSRLSSTLRPSTTYKPYTISRSPTHSNIRWPLERNSGWPTQRSMLRRTRPTPSSSGARVSPDKTLTFDTMTVLTAEQSYTSTSAPYSSKDIDNAISSTYNHITGFEATTANIVGFEPSTKDMPTKPRVVGGNAASFTVLSNSDAFLPCEAAGNPEPTISWKRFSSSTGNTITIKGKMGKFEVFKNGTLSIHNANIKDRGQYVCLVENDQGSDKLLVTLSVVAYPSRILEPKLRDIKVHSGRTVEMKCKAEGRPIPLISWILANRTQVRGHNADQGRVSVTPEGTLVIRQVSVYDRGHYKCIASNPAGADTATIRLQVVAAPPGILEEKRQQVEAGVGQSLGLACTGQGSPQPTVHWVLYDGSVVRSNRPAQDHRLSLSENGTLRFESLATTDSGRYECIATSSTGSERRVVTLTVEKRETAPQIVEASPRRTELSYGEQLRLNCSTIGDPVPRILWRLPSKAVVDKWHKMGNRIRVLDNGTLVIDSVSSKDAGDYLCVARSSAGEDLQLMRLSVSMTAAKIEAKVYGKKQVPYGNDLKVDCKASGAPEPEISWGLPDGTLVNSALQSDSSGVRGRSRRYVLFDNGTLYLNQVSMSEEGDYTCYAENQLGKDEMHVHITVVTAAPRIRSPSLSYAKVPPGGNLRFDCEAVGEPKPKILWMLPTHDMIAASNERYLMHVNGSLDIRDVKQVDAGEYVCVARNAGGEDRRVYKLDLDGNPPVINGYHRNRTVVTDTAAKYSRKFIDCKAEGEPNPKVTWIMPDNIFLTAPYFGSRINVHPNGTLEIRNVRPTDTAEFICMARNEGGEAVMVVQLEITSVLRRPIFRNPFNERLVTRTGKTAVLNCSADGHPTPEITWLLPNGSRFTGSPRGARHQLGSDGTFVIYNPNQEDSGKYRCSAKNSVGYIEKVVVLEVGQKPYILTRPRGVIRSVSGEPLFLHCLADGRPRPQVYWTVPAGLTLMQPQVHGRHQLLENGTLVVRDTTLQDRGNYVCRARNDAGEAALTVPVIIIAYPPRITAGPSPSVGGVAGAPITLNCVAIGIPKPEISWVLPDGSVLSTAGQGRPRGSELLHPQGTLIIQRPTAADSGTYKCLAKNHLGTDTRLTQVRVL
ncbi:immunoglobulin superfamily member 10 [Aplochiton taeniatus]